VSDDETIAVLDGTTVLDGRKYMELVRAQSCAATRIKTPTRWTPCRGRIEAHHAGPRPGVAMKADDTTTIPLCTQHHREWHGATGPFKHWTKDQRRAWSDAMIDLTRRRILGEKA
jgi:hypothetical protein